MYAAATATITTTTKKKEHCPLSGNLKMLFESSLPFFGVSFNFYIHGKDESKVYEASISAELRSMK